METKTALTSEQIKDEEDRRGVTSWIGHQVCGADALRFLDPRRFLSNSASSRYCSGDGGLFYVVMDKRPEHRLLNADRSECFKSDELTTSQLMCSSLVMESICEVARRLTSKA